MMRIQRQKSCASPSTSSNSLEAECGVATTGIDCSESWFVRHDTRSCGEWTQPVAKQGQHVDSDTSLVVFYWSNLGQAFVRKCRVRAEAIAPIKLSFTSAFPTAVRCTACCEARFATAFFPPGVQMSTDVRGLRHGRAAHRRQRRRRDPVAAESSRMARLVPPETGRAVAGDHLFVISDTCLLF